MRWYKDGKSGQIRSVDEWNIVDPDSTFFEYEEVCQLKGKWYNLNRDVIPQMDVDLAMQVQAKVGNASDQEFLDQYRILHREKFNSEFEIL